MSASGSPTRRLGGAALRGTLVGIVLGLLILGLGVVQPGPAPSDPAMLAVVATDTPEALASVDAAPPWPSPAN